MTEDLSNMSEHTYLEMKRISKREQMSLPKTLIWVREVFGIKAEEIYLKKHTRDVFRKARRSLNSKPVKLEK